MIYLCDVATIAPQALERHTRRFERELVPQMARCDAELLGLFRTWRSHELWAFFELPGYAALDRLERAARENEALRAYEEQAAPERLSARSRILHPTPFCPDLRRIRAEGLRGGAYLLAVIPLRPERMEEYLRLFPERGLALEERHGLRTVGYWRGGGGEPYQTEAFTFTQLCVGESFEFFERFYTARARDPEVAAWMHESYRYRTHHVASYLVPVHVPS